MAVGSLPKLDLDSPALGLDDADAMGGAIGKRHRDENEVGAEAEPPKKARSEDEENSLAVEPARPDCNILRYFVGVAETIGKKRTMEDRSSVRRLGDGSVYAGVFDGHSGALAADHAANTLWKKMDDHEGDTAAHRFEAAFAKCEREILACGYRDGTTACTVRVEGEDLAVANLGDSRCVLGSTGGDRRRRLSERLTTDHKPDLPSERARIERNGGSVVRHGGVAYRVSHENCPLLLAVSRSLGDRPLKRHRGLVSPEPEVRARRLKANDDFLILATDGLWDVISDKEAVALVYDVIGEALATSSVTQALCTEAAAKCIKAARKRYTMDNVLVLVLAFQWRK